VPYGGTKTAWTYTTDAGVQYRVSLASYITSQTNGATPPVPLIGGAAATAAIPPKPASLKMRYTTVRDETDKISRKVYLMEPNPANVPLMTEGTTINLAVAGALKAFTSGGFWTAEVNGRRVQK